MSKRRQPTLLSFAPTYAGLYPIRAALAAPHRIEKILARNRSFSVSWRVRGMRKSTTLSFIDRWHEDGRAHIGVWLFAISPRHLSQSGHLTTHARFARRLSSSVTEILVLSDSESTRQSRTRRSAICGNLLGRVFVGPPSADVCRSTPYSVP